MGNIVDYVKEYSAVSFKDRAFCIEDAMVLCQFAYLKFDKILKPLSEMPVELKDLSKYEEFESLFTDFRHEKDNRALFNVLFASDRFKHVKLCMYINRIEIKEETQFAAITFLCPENNILIVFRGTDENMVGWQEDFALALNKPITGQKLSVKYLNDVAERISGEFYVAGHSKGGNLALFSSMCAGEKVKNKIKAVFSFDGPGFRPEFLVENNYDEIKDRVVKVIPKSSVVGMIFNNEENAKVVDASSLGLSQHYLFNWVIEAGDFKEASLSDQHKMLLKSMNDWILSLEEDRLERFVHLLDKLLDATQVDTTLDFTKDMFNSSLNVLKATEDVDDETWNFLSQFIKSYFTQAKETVKEEAKCKAEEALQKIEATFDNTKEWIKKKG